MSQEDFSMSPKASPRPSIDGDEIPMTAATRTRTALFTVLVACGALSFGFSIGLTGPLSALTTATNICLPTEFLGDINLFSVFASLLNIGAMFGAVSGGVIADRLGRRGAFMVACSISIAGSCCIIFGSAIWILHGGRFINGFGMGLFSLLVPMYISETAPASLRGSMGTCNQLGITVGLAIAIAIGIPIADDLEKKEWWRYVAAISTVPAIVLLLGIIFYVPETPRWLLSQGRVPDALDALKRLRGSTFNSDAELKQLQIAHEESARQGGPTGLMQQLKVMFSRTYLRPLSIAIGLQIVQQFTGINGVFFYLGSLFSKASQDCNSDNVRYAILFSTLGACLQVVGTLLSLYLIDKAGRRVLLSSSLVGMGACLAVGGCAVFFKWPSALTSTAVCGYIFCFAIGCGPVPWLMMSEVMPSRIRGPAMSLGTLSNWLSAFIVVQITPFLAVMGSSPTRSGPFAEFWMFAAMCVLAIMWMYTAVPETKGRTLEEIEAMLVKGYQSSNAGATAGLLQPDSSEA